MKKSRALGCVLAAVSLLVAVVITPFVPVKLAAADTTPLSTDKVGILNMETLPNSKQGIRFTQTLVTTDGASGREVVTVGSAEYPLREVHVLAAVTSNVASVELKAENAGTNGIQDIRLMNYKSKSEVGNQNTYTFTAYIENVGRHSRSTQVSVRAYVVCDDGQGGTIKVYGDTATASTMETYQLSMDAGIDFKATVDKWMTIDTADYIRNRDVFSARYLSDTPGYEYVTKSGFYVDSHYYETPKTDFWFNVELNKSSLEYYGFYTGKSYPGEANVAEWGYNFSPFLDTNGTGNKTGCGIPLIDGLNRAFREKAPTSRAEALETVKHWVVTQYASKINNSPWGSINGHYLWNHYAAEAGASMIGSEVGEEIMHTQASLAFTRGAGRQYKLPTLIDFSEWYGNAIPGHSPSLIERTGMSVYMGGISFLLAEAGCLYSMERNEFDGDYYALSDSGQARKKLIDFVEKYPDIGAAYTPFGLVLDRYHGITPGSGFDDRQGGPLKAFTYFEYNAGDHMTYNLLDKFFPGAWDRSNGGNNEQNYQVNGPYGDTCDVLTQNASYEVLNSYPCLILSGDITFTAEEKNNIINYVTNGGTLIINATYLPQFTDWQNHYPMEGGVRTIGWGAGNVVMYGSNTTQYDISLLDGIIKEQLAKHIPFQITTADGSNIEYMVNVKDSTLLVTLINNDGASREYELNCDKNRDISNGVLFEVYTDGTNIYSSFEAGTRPDLESTGVYNYLGNPTVDLTKTKTVTVNYTGAELTPRSITEIYQDDQTLYKDGKGATLQVKPGEIKVLEFKFCTDKESFWNSNPDKDGADFNFGLG